MDLEIFNNINIIVQPILRILTLANTFFLTKSFIDITASNEELENIQKMQEELYVSELELSELTKRNSFLNCMQDESSHQSKPKFTQRKSIQLQ